MSYPTYESLYQGAGTQVGQDSGKPLGVAAIEQSAQTQGSEMNPWAGVRQPAGYETPPLGPWEMMMQNLPQQQAPQQSQPGKK